MGSYEFDCRSSALSRVTGEKITIYGCLESTISQLPGCQPKQTADSVLLKACEDESEDSYYTFVQVTVYSSDLCKKIGGINEFSGR